MHRPPPLPLETLQAIVEGASDGFFVTDAEFRIEWVNESACRLLGQTYEALIGRRISDLLADDDQVDPAPLRRNDLLAGRATMTLRTFRTGDGGRRILEVSAKRIGDGVLLGIARDATARLEAEARLARSEASFRAVIEASPDSVVVHREGKIVWINSAGAKLVGASSPEELLGRPVIELVHPDEREMVRKRIAALHRGEPTVPFTDERVLRRDGRIVEASVGAVRVVFEGHPSIAVIARDLSAARRAQEQLAQADRMASLGTLAAGVAHEINNPLTYVLLHLDALSSLAARRTELPASFADRLAEHVAHASEGARRVARIVRDLRVFSRSEDDVRTPVDVHRPIELAISTASHELKHRARLVRSFANVPPVLGSEGRLAQVFLNLLLNAAQAIPEGRPSDNEVRVETRFESGEVLVRVSDTGVGIPEEHRRRLFEPFFTTKGVGEGSGLGLAICHGLVTAMSGRIAVQSEVGKGTCFTIAFPPAREEDRATDPQVVPSANARTRILVVDDEVAIGQALQRALGDRHDVVFVPSTREARHLLERDDRFDVILCDIFMPESSGLELHRWLSERRSSLASRVIFSTGGRLDADARALRDLEPRRFLEKPFTVDALEARIEELRART